jgi:hypothetical protein
LPLLKVDQLIGVYFDPTELSYNFSTIYITVTPGISKLLTIRQNKRIFYFLHLVFVSHVRDFSLREILVPSVFTRVKMEERGGIIELVHYLCTDVYVLS